jgi:alkanesulfonate monooxygenase SsuD/methylene tetrahydromethanopterin reductase-like flavin-dependent oxidoreductase (luciferase family)
MNTRIASGVALSVALALAFAWFAPARAEKIRKRDTIASLEGKSVDIRPGSIIVDSTDKARDNYRAFLDLVSDDPELRAEAMRRLADLELEATETEQLARLPQERLSAVSARACLRNCRQDR